jgi:hypothetical protein
MEKKGDLSGEKKAWKEKQQTRKVVEKHHGMHESAVGIACKYFYLFFVKKVVEKKINELW